MWPEHPKTAIVLRVVQTKRKFIIHDQKGDLEECDIGLGSKNCHVRWQNYYYIFSNVDEFETLQERYNIATALGRAEQYLSNYDKDENEFNLKILKVLATEDCLTLAEYFEQHKIGLKGKSSGKRLFERLGEDFFRKKLNTELVVKSDELKKILPRLTQEEEANACLRAILSQEKKWRIPRIQIQLNNQTRFAVWG